MVLLPAALHCCRLYIMVSCLLPAAALAHPASSLPPNSGPLLYHPCLDPLRLGPLLLLTPIPAPQPHLAACRTLRPPF
jgi:hypothetical protein